MEIFTFAKKIAKKKIKFIKFSNHTCSYRTRGPFLLRPKFQRTTFTQQSIKYRRSKTWDSLPNSIKSTRT